MASCSWCSSWITAARRDAIYCSKRCRQAAHRAKVPRVDREATDRPLRLAYADPPYIGLSRKYYGDQSSFAGEVDHRELVSRLASYDGWALSCSSASVPAIAALLVAQDLPVGFQEDRKRLEAGCYREQTRRALALLPQRGADARTPAGEEQGAGRRLAKSGGEQ